MCSCVPTATVWRWPEARGALSASSTVSVTSPPTRIASQTLTLRGATFRRIGPASTRGLLLSDLLSDSQGMIDPRVGDELVSPDYMSIFATDRGDPASLERARAGLYPAGPRHSGREGYRYETKFRVSPP